MVINVLGIDVGKSGAIAIIKPLSVWVGAQRLIGKQPDEGWMECLTAQRLPTHCFIEMTQAMPKQGRSSIMTYGTHSGLWRGMLAAHKIPYTIVAPNRWKKAMGVTKEKKSSILMAQRLFPGMSLLPTDKCKKPSDGMAEALLIAEYGRRVLAGIGGG